MKVNVIRGQNQMGGTIIEISTETSRIILDAGLILDETRKHHSLPQVPGLFSGKASYDAVFISHYHLDHMALIEHIVPGIPVYMSEKTYTLSKIFYKKGRLFASEPKFFESMKPVVIGNITLTPIPCDHSAYDTHMFLVEADEQSILYTADYRSTGRRDFNELLATLPTKLDVLISEGSTLLKSEAFRAPSEYELEEIAVNEINAACQTPVFFYSAARDIDRLITAHNAAIRSGRRFMADDLTASVISAAGLDWSDMEIWQSNNIDSDAFICISPKNLKEVLTLYMNTSHSKSIRNGGILFFARREEYMLRPNIALLINSLRSKGLKIVPLHTGGHADRATLERLIEHVDPSSIVPVHTKYAGWFRRFGDRAEIVYECRDYEILHGFR